MKKVILVLMLVLAGAYTVTSYATNSTMETTISVDVDVGFDASVGILEVAFDVLRIDVKDDLKFFGIHSEGVEVPSPFKEVVISEHQYCEVLLRSLSKEYNKSDIRTSNFPKDESNFIYRSPRDAL